MNQALFSSSFRSSSFIIQIMGEKLKPEDQLRKVRAKAQAFFEQYEAAKQLADESQSESAGNPLSADQLNLFLRSLNLQLKSAIAEVQASSKDLAELAAEVRRVEAQWGRGN